MNRYFLTFGLLVLSALTWASYKGWAFTNYETLRDVPKSVRANPSSYRSIYVRVPHK
jgi:hypothetical protein